MLFSFDGIKETINNTVKRDVVNIMVKHGSELIIGMKHNSTPLSYEEEYVLAGLLLYLSGINSCKFI